MRLFQIYTFAITSRENYICSKWK